MLAYNVFNDVNTLSDIFDNFFAYSPVVARWREYPYIELYENENGFEIRALVPGLKSEDIDLKFVDNNLIIEGNKKEDYTDHKYLKKERSFGKFKKSVKISSRIEVDAIKAELKDGILIIRLNKGEDDKPKKIEIN